MRVSLITYSLSNTDSLNNYCGTNFSKNASNLLNRFACALMLEVVLRARYWMDILQTFWPVHLETVDKHWFWSVCTGDNSDFHSLHGQMVAVLIESVKKSKFFFQVIQSWQATLFVVICFLTYNTAWMFVLCLFCRTHYTVTCSLPEGTNQI